LPEEVSTVHSGRESDFFILFFLILIVVGDGEGRLGEDLVNAVEGLFQQSPEDFVIGGVVQAFSLFFLLTLFLGRSHGGQEMQGNIDAHGKSPEREARRGVLTGG
jgi:hypothetical protein